MFRILLILSLLGCFACKRSAAAHPGPNPIDITAGQSAIAQPAGSGGSPEANSAPSAPIAGAGTPAAGMDAVVTAAGANALLAGTNAQASAAHASAGESGHATESAGNAGVTTATAGESGAGGQAASSGTGGETAWGSGGTRGIQPGKRGQPGRCRLPRSCQTIDSFAFTLTACCLEGNECGYELTNPPELRDLLAQMQAEQAGATGGFDALAACVPATEIFRREPGQEERRIPNPGGMDQLITPECETRALLAFPLPGCCLPNNRCGISTYQIHSILQAVVIFPAPFTDVECVSVEELNNQFRATLFAGAAQIPASNGACNYADLNMRLSAADDSGQ